MTRRIQNIKSDLLQAIGDIKGIQQIPDSQLVNHFDYISNLRNNLSRTYNPEDADENSALQLANGLHHTIHAEIIRRSINDNSSEHPYEHPTVLETVIDDCTVRVDLLEVEKILEEVQEKYRQPNAQRQTKAQLKRDFSYVNSLASRVNSANNDYFDKSGKTNPDAERVSMRLKNLSKRISKLWENK
jgi:hypothetical protein